MANYGLWQGLERTTGQMAQTGMRLMEFRAQREHQQAVEALQRDRFNIEKEEEKRAVAEFNYEQEQRTIGETPIDPNDHLARMGFSPGVNKMLLERAEREGLIEQVAGRKIIRQKNVVPYIKSLNADLPFRYQVEKSELDAIDAQLTQLRTDFVKKPDDEKIQQAIKGLEAKKKTALYGVDALEYKLGMKKADITKTWEPKKFVGPGGAMKWIAPGESIPEGWIPYEKAAEGEGTWSAPYPLGGAMVQENYVTGEIRTVVTREPKDKPEKLTMTDVKSAYSMDIGNIKNQMMIEMTPDEQINLAGQPDVNILALLLAGRVGKSLSPERKKYYIGKLQEVEKYYGDLINQVLGRKGAKIPQPEKGKIGVPELAPSQGVPKEGLIEVPGGFRYIRPK